MKKIIKPLITFVLSFLFISSNGQNEPKELNIKKISTSTSKVNIVGASRPLINEDGRIVGRFTPNRNGNKVVYTISPEDKPEYVLDALNGFHYVEGMHLIMFGSSVDECIDHEMQLTLYSENGVQKAKYSETLYSPFNAYPGPKGNIYVTGKSDKNDPNSPCVIRKLNSSLDKQWEIEFHNGFIQFLKASNSGNYLIAVLYQIETHSIRTMLINSENGNILGEVSDMNTINSAEFIEEQNLIILAGAGNLNAYKLDINFGLLKIYEIQIPLNTVSFGFSISVNQERSLMAVAHCSDLSEDNSQISFYDIKTGKFLRKIELPGDRTMRSYRVLNFISDKSFEVLTKDHTYTYEYAY